MLGDRIKLARHNKGISIKRLSDLSGISAYKIRKFEDNRVTPDSIQIISLANSLDVKPEFFFRKNNITVRLEDTLRRHIG